MRLFRFGYHYRLDIEIILKPNAVYVFLITLPDIDLESQRRIAGRHCIP